MGVIGGGGWKDKGGADTPLRTMFGRVYLKDKMKPKDCKKFIEALVYAKHFSFVEPIFIKSLI